MFKKKKKNNYFELLKELSAYTEEAARFLDDAMTDYRPEDLSESLLAMHEIEHTADLAHHALNRSLAREFITPIDRQDFSMIAGMIDDVTDSIEDVLMRLYMFNVKELRYEAHEFCRIIVDGSRAMSRILSDFENFRKSDAIRRHIIEANDLEEEADAVYVRSIRRLYEESEDPIEVISWSEIFRRLESCCDDFENVSQAVEQVIMKNT